MKSPMNEIASHRFGSDRLSSVQFVPGYFHAMNSKRIPTDHFFTIILL